MKPQVDILGVHVSAINIGEATHAIETWIHDRARHYVCVTGVHGVMECQEDPDLLEIHNMAGMVTPDGMPLVWCGRFAGVKTMDRVYGPDLMLAVCEESVGSDWKHFFYGAGAGVAQALAENLQGWYPGLKVVGTYSPPYRDLTPSEKMNIVDMIENAGPDVVWIGLSTPKQEKWMSEFRPLLKAPVLIGVGAAFDMHGGDLRQAPLWMQRGGLEWLFRLLMEPRRLWRRYLSNNPRFVFSIMRRRPQLVKSDEDVHGTEAS